MDWHLFLLVNDLAGHWHGLNLIMRWIAVYTPLLFLAHLAYFWFGSLEEARAEKPLVSHGIKLLLPHSADVSFPSDHAAGAWALAWSLRSHAVHYAMMSLALMVMWTS